MLHIFSYKQLGQEIVGKMLMTLSEFHPKMKNSALCFSFTWVLFISQT